MLVVNFKEVNTNKNAYNDAIDKYKSAVNDFSNGNVSCTDTIINNVLTTQYSALKEKGKKLSAKLEESSNDIEKAMKLYFQVSEKLTRIITTNKTSKVVKNNTEVLKNYKNNSAKILNIGGELKLADDDSSREYDLVDASANPNFNNTKAWKTNNIYYKSGYCGQCTWFAAGKFYEVYGYAPGFNGNGRDCAAQLVKAHPDKFALSNVPVAGSIFSCGYNTRTKNHTGMVVAVDGDRITIQHGNFNGKSDSFDVAVKDWGTQTMSLAEFKRKYNNDVIFANPLKQA